MHWLLLPLVLASDPVSVQAVPLPKPPAPTRLTAEPGVPLGFTAGKPATFAFAVEPTDAVLYPRDGDVWVFVAPRSASPGSEYAIVGSTGVADGIIRVTICVGSSPPPPSPPQPMPPADPLVTALRAAYAADTSPRKAESLAQLVALYDEAVKLPHAKREDGGYRYATISSVALALRTASASLLPDALMDVRRLTVAELQNTFSVDAPLTEANRDKLAATFRRIANALRQVQ